MLWFPFPVMTLTLKFRPTTAWSLDGAREEDVLLEVISRVRKEDESCNTTLCTHPLICNSSLDKASFTCKP